MTRGMTPADLFRIQWVSDARIAPDGRTLAFTVTRLDEEADDYRSATWVVPADGSAPPRRFTGGGGKDSAPRWSPDGTRLAFLSDRDGGKAQVCVIDVAGGEARKLSAIPQGAGAPEWSAQGARSRGALRIATSPKRLQHISSPPSSIATTVRVLRTTAAATCLSLTLPVVRRASSPMVIGTTPSRPGRPIVAAWPLSPPAILTATTTVLRTSLWWTPRAVNRYGSHPEVASARCQPGRRTDGALPISAILTLRTPPATAVCGWSRLQAALPAV
jgi:WD40-like Beta Propeller Repeat